MKKMKKAKTKSAKYQKIAQKKESTKISDLCKNFPAEFEKYLKYCRGLGFDEIPNYNYCRNLFRRVFKKYNFKDDGVYDWCIQLKAYFITQVSLPILI